MLHDRQFLAPTDMPDTTTKRVRNTLAALASVVASGYFAYDFRWQQGIAALEEEAAGRLNVASAAVFAPTQKFSYLPDLLASHPLIVDTLQHRQDRTRVAQANALLEQTNGSARAAAIYVLDHEGSTVASSNWREPDSFVGRNYAFRPYFRNALAGGKASFYGVGATTGVPGYFVAHVVRKGERALGVAVVKADMMQLDQDWRRGDDEIAVSDENGVVFLSTRPEWKYRPLRPLDAPTLENIRQTRQYGAMLKPPLTLQLLRQLQDNEMVIALAQDGEPESRYFVRSQAVDGVGWTINVLIPLEELEGRALRIALIVSSAFGLILMSLMYVRQAQVRAEEREKSRLALEQAHQALEHKHSELQKVSEDLRLASVTDPLTGAHNRRFFFESLPKIVSATNRHHFPLSIVTIDVDHFKRINDMYGHPAGDKVLQALTAVCKESLREADVFCRFGGEEFIMALPNTDAATAANVAERLRIKVTERPVDIHGEPFGITVSCGVSQYLEGERGIEQTLRRADEALYIAKKEGRNRVVVR